MQEARRSLGGRGVDGAHSVGLVPPDLAGIGTNDLGLGINERAHATNLRLPGPGIEANFHRPDQKCQRIDGSAGA
jgi:hypothetical protein